MKTVKATEIDTYRKYRIKDYSNHYGKNSYSVEGCIWMFTSVEDVKDYIDEHDSIKPSDAGVMKYIGTVID